MLSAHRGSKYLKKYRHRFDGVEVWAGWWNEREATFEREIPRFLSTDDYKVIDPSPKTSGPRDAPCYFAYRTPALEREAEEFERRWRGYYLIAMYPDRAMQWSIQSFYKEFEPVSIVV